MTRLATLALFAVLMAPGFPHAGELRSPKPNLVNTGTVDHSNAYKWYTYQHGCPTLASQCTAGVSVSGDTFDKLDLIVSRYGFQFGNSDHDVTLSNCKIASTKINSGGDFPAAVQIVGEKVDNITINDCEFSGFQMVPVAGKYINGDGVDDDGGAGHLYIRRTYSHDNSDGGFDLKGKAELWDTKAANNYRNYRFWHDEIAHTITSINPRNAHVWFGATSTSTVDLLIASGDNGVAVFAADKVTANPKVSACQFNFSVPTKVFSASIPKAMQAKFGPSCQPDAKGYAVNTAPPVVPPPVVTPPVTVPPVVVKSAVTVCSKTALKNGNGDASIRISTTATWKALGLSGPTTVNATPQKTDACPFLYTVAP